MVLPKFAIEEALHEEKKDIAAGLIKEDNPLDFSDDFRILCEASRRGDLKTCQQKLSEGVNINARDKYDYTPLILASLCGHYETVQLLLESGALCERDTFQGERCLYNALNDRIRDLLVSYDFSKSTNLLQPLTAHVTALRTRHDWPTTADMTLTTEDASFALHKFLLAARSPYFAQKLRAAPDTATCRLSHAVPTQSVETVLRHVYLGEVTVDQTVDAEQQAVLTGIDWFSKHMQVGCLFDDILRSSDRRLARQIYDDQTAAGRDQLAVWFQDNVAHNRMRVPSNKVADVRWDRDNSTFADVLLVAHEQQDELDEEAEAPESNLGANGIPTGAATSANNRLEQPHSVLFPVHRAMLLRSEFFALMFGSDFKEAQELTHLQVIPIDCSPQVLEIVLTYLYTEKSDFPLDVAIEVLFAADMLIIDKLKQRAGVIISTLGSGSGAAAATATNGDARPGVDDFLDVFEVIRAGWITRVQRLEEFGARYIAYRLERFIDDPEFAEIIKESASRIKDRQAVDSIELIDDIRYHLSERFRLRFEETGLEALMLEVDVGKAGQDVSRGEGGKAEENEEEGTGTSEDVSIKEAAVGKTRQQSLAVTDIRDSRTLDSREVDDDFASDAINYQILLGRIDTLLESLDLDA